MKIGMLWFDNDPKADLAVKIGRAAAYYSKKYGQAPNLCFVHPSVEPPARNGKNGSQNTGFANIEIRTHRSVRPNHFWIGIADRAVQP